MTVIRFETFEMDINSRRLLDGGKPVRIGARAFDLLRYLALNAGRILSKAELLEAVWPKATVDEIAIRVHLVELRKILRTKPDDPWIRAVPGRGYLFLKPVEMGRLAKPGPVDAGLPYVPAEILGRSTFIESSIEVLEVHRLQSIIGTGGIGKTSEAVEIGNHFRAIGRTVIFLDLSTLTADSQLVSYLAMRLDLISFAEDPMPMVLATLAEQPYMLVFDNCEHVIGGCAEIVETILCRTGSTTVLATSREPLGVMGEYVSRLPPLSYPDEGVVPKDVSEYSALRLFADRVELASGHLDFTKRETISAAADVVRALDGIPLAIELAASRAVHLGVSDLLASLNHPIATLRKGRRTAPARHQTLEAMLDWSYRLLNSNEQTVLAAISVFSGDFQLQSARLISGDPFAAEDFEDAFNGLVAKSRISLKAGSFRLLETTRAYVRVQLQKSPADESNFRKNHAHYVLQRLVASETDWKVLSVTRWYEVHGDLIGDLRGALDWCMRSQHMLLGATLMIQAHAVWLQLGLYREGLEAVEAALLYVEDSAIADSALEARLRVLRGGLLFHVRSLETGEDIIREFNTASELANTVQDGRTAVLARSGLFSMLMVRGRYADAVSTAQKLIPGDTEAATAASQCLTAYASLYAGDIDRTNAISTAYFLENPTRSTRTTTSAIGQDHRVLHFTLMAKSAWLSGQAGVAKATIEDALRETVEIDQPSSLALLLAAGAYPIYSSLGFAEEAKRHLQWLQEISERSSFGRLKIWADQFESLARARSGAAGRAVLSIEPWLHSERYMLEHMAIVGGQNLEERLLDWILDGDAGWCRAEALRLKAERVAGAEQSLAIELLDAGIEFARQRGHLVWELRCAACLARLTPRGLDALKSVIARYPETPSQAERDLIARFF
ncbi:ATP-binding protein [Rhizobium sp.]|uniref:ATP-binding protein n=1 Tax=Rhizobium sp. TaxID=391 RepID=UPI0028A838B5